MSLNEPLGEHEPPIDLAGVVAAVHRPLAGHIARVQGKFGRPIIVGLCGGQGSGKSTLAASLQAALVDAGLAAAVLSLDDIYYSHEFRQDLARRIHPLLATRGPPGTHDVELGRSILDELTRSGHQRIVSLPRFDKAEDTRRPSSEHLKVVAPVQVVIFEGWCVGARPQSVEALAEPINALERHEDADRRWREHVNDRLGVEYQPLFRCIDLMIMLQAPSFDQIFAWRVLQEHELAARTLPDGAGSRRTMDDQELERFVMHFERLTRHMMAEMPARADVLIRLGEGHQVLSVSLP